MESIAGGLTIVLSLGLSLIAGRGMLEAAFFVMRRSAVRQVEVHTDK
jgi:hypothetical protein